MTLGLSCVKTLTITKECQQTSDSNSQSPCTHKVTICFTNGTTSHQNLGGQDIYKLIKALQPEQIISGEYLTHFNQFDPRRIQRRFHDPYSGLPKEQDAKDIIASIARTAKEITLNFSEGTENPP